MTAYPPLPHLSVSQAALLLELPPHGATLHRRLYGGEHLTARTLVSYGLAVELRVEAVSMVPILRYTRSAEGDALVAVHRRTLVALTRRAS